jgi:hypothetical protein
MLKSRNSQESLKRANPQAQTASAKPEAKKTKSKKPQLKLVENETLEPAKPKRNSAKSTAKAAAPAAQEKTAAKASPRRSAPTSKKHRATATPKARIAATPAGQIPDLALPSVSLTAATLAVNRPAFVPTVAATQSAEPLEPYWLHSPSAPLPRNASLAVYRKPGLFGLIGSWLRNTVTSITGDDRKRSHWAGQRKAAKRKPALGTMHELAALRDENVRLRAQIEALTTKDG